MEGGGLFLQDAETRLALQAAGIKAELPWCRANVALDLGPEELPRLADGLRRLATDGHGSFLWANDGGEVRIEVVMAKRGETHWSVRLQSPPDFLNELRLVFVGRQEELEGLAQTL